MPSKNDLLIGDKFDGLLWGGRAIAAYIDRPEKWLRHQLERGKRPPPVFRIGPALVATPAEIDAWLDAHKRKQRS